MHIAQQMPLPLTISCSSKSRLVLTFLVLAFWYLLTWVVPDILQKSSKTIVCVCVVCVCNDQLPWQRPLSDQKMVRSIINHLQSCFCYILKICPAQGEPLKREETAVEHIDINMPPSNCHEWGISFRYTIPCNILVWQRGTEQVACLLYTSDAADE